MAANPDLKAVAAQLRALADACEKQSKTVQAGADASLALPPWMSLLLTVLKTVLEAVPIA